MSTGKRLAKRSVLGTRVMAPGIDGLYEPGMIQAMKTYEDPSLLNRYSVRFDESRRVVEFLESDIVGPGFQTITAIHLQPGQVVYVTHNQREMQARVIRHDFDTQDVLLRLNEDNTILRKLDEVRLLESRKSARLVNSDTDFSKLAEGNLSDNYRNMKKSSKAIEVPRSDYVQIAGSRKRRTSENIPDEFGYRDVMSSSIGMVDSDDEEEVMTECSAALLLMKLSCSPHSPAIFGSSAPASSSSSSSFRQVKMLPSPVESSSGASSFRSSTPSPPLSTSVTDEGIVKDISDASTLHQNKSRVIYQCTYPGCHEERLDVRAIEVHVRRQHLGRDPDDQFDDGEEEFYYTEVEIPAASVPSKTASLIRHTSGSTSSPHRVRSYSHSVVFDLSLADHLDMARPPHEDPGLTAASAARAVVAASAAPAVRRPAKVRSFSGGNRFNNASLLTSSQPQSHQNPLTLPITIAPSPGSPGKFILISPQSASSATGLKSPSRRTREGKKCRKVYGLEQRDLWCTQCKWKKACARFGSHAQDRTSVGSLPNTSSNSLLMTASETPTSFDSSAIKAIKF